MSAIRHAFRRTFCRSPLTAALLLAVPLFAAAQEAPAPASSTSTMDMGAMSGMDHASMQGMDTSGMSDKPALAPKKAKRASKSTGAESKADASTHVVDHDSMQGMDMGAMPSAPAQPKTPTPASPQTHGHEGGAQSAMEHGSMAGMGQGAMPGMQHGAMPGAGHGSMRGMTMGPMQGGSPPPDARSPDYSDGTAYGPMKGMDMADNAPFGMLLFDQLEYANGRDANSQIWEAQGWYGTDSDKLWMRTEGDRSNGRIENADVEGLWYRAVAPYWGTQLGLRQDFGDGPGRSWAAFGVEGLAPYWFELAATAYVGQSGRSAVRLRAEYELLFTQRLILQPEFEVNLYGKDDPARRIGSGLSDAEFGLRLRYEIRRQFAPYVGVLWSRRLGRTADYAREDGRSPFDRQFVAGVRIWF